jgi:regulator of sigma E protease
MTLTMLFGFIVTLGVLIIVHEFAHYRVAVAFGVKVQRFSVGFGRVLWRRQPRPDGTEFVLSALPLGGYVRWIDDRESPPITAEERPYTFASKPLWQRALIVAAGPVSNLVLAVFLFAASYWLGVDEPKALIASPPAGSLAERAGLKGGELVQAIGSVDDGQVQVNWTELRSISDLRWEVIRAALRGNRVVLRASDAEGRGAHEVELAFDRIDSRDLDTALSRHIGLGAPFGVPVIANAITGGPAAQAGLQRGDRVLEIDGAPAGDAPALIETIRRSAHGGTVPSAQRWVIEREGQRQVLTVTPRVAEDKGQRVGRVDAEIAQSAPAMTLVRYGFVEGFERGLRRTWEVSTLTLKMLGRMITGQASVRNLSGPLTIAQVAGQAIEHGLAYYLGILALVSVSLGVLNLLPLPLLDGGHLMYYIFEAVTGRPVAGAWLKWLQGGGALIMLLLMSLALYNDLARLLGLH